MGRIKTIVTLLKTNPQKLPWVFMEKFSACRISHLLSDRIFLKMRYRSVFGRKLDLKCPKTFNEKLQWLKLYNRNPEYCKLVDKYEVKKIVSDMLGEEYIIPTLGVWDHFEDIDFDSLPNRFVLKCTHDSGSVVLCRDKNTFDVEAARKKLTKKLASNLFWHGREWPYKDVRPRIMAEEYMEDTQTADLRDYKFYCFDGVPKIMLMASNRNKAEQTYFDYFDMEFNWLDMQWGNPNSPQRPQKPDKFEEMVETAKVLSKGIPHVRVDLYVVNGQVYFGELTFFDGSGMQAITPYEYDLMMGEWINLPGDANVHE